jgi:hypothetical protein
LALKNLAFGEESHPHKPTDGGSIKNGIEDQAVPQDVTIKVTEQGNELITGVLDGIPAIADAGANGESSGNGVSNGHSDGLIPDGEPEAPSSEKEQEEEKGVEMSIDELLAQRA